MWIIALLINISYLSANELPSSTSNNLSADKNISLSMELQKKEIGKIIEEYSKDHTLRGTLLVAQGEEVLFSKSFGLANEKEAIPNIFETQYLIGSITKQFTAAALLKTLYNKHAPSIKDERILEAVIQKDLDKKVSDYLPPHHPLWEGHMPDWANQVTLHHLLTHSSGLPNYTNLPGFQGFILTPPSLPKLVSFFKNERPDFNPGKKYSYCNSGYLILGEIIHQISGKCLGEFLENEFFTPLRMTSTYLATQGRVHDLQREERGKNLACGHQVNILGEDFTPSEVENYWPMQLALGAGGMVSAVSDCLKWNNALYKCKVFPDFLVRMMLKPSHLIRDGDFYGYGIVMKNPATNSAYYWHTGGIAGFMSNLIYIPAINLSLIAISNISPNPAEFISEIEKIKITLPSRLSAEKREVFMSLSRSQELKLLSHILTRNYPQQEEIQKKWLSTPNVLETIVSKILLNGEGKQIRHEDVDQEIQSILEELYQDPQI